MHHRRAHGLQNRLELVEYLFLAAYHEGQGAVNSLGLAAGHRGIQHVDAVLRQLCSDFTGSHGIDGGAVDKRRRLGHLLGQLVVLQHDGLDVRAVGQHGDHQIHALGSLGGAGANLRTCSLHFFQGTGIAVKHTQLIARLQQVLRHGLAHDAQTDKCNFHCRFLLDANPNNSLY